MLRGKSAMIACIYKLRWLPCYQATEGSWDDHQVEMLPEAAPRMLRELLPRQKQIAHEFFGNNGIAGLSPVSQNSPQTIPNHTKGFLKFTWCTPVLKTPHGSLVPMAYGVYIFNRALGMRKVRGLLL